MLREKGTRISIPFPEWKALFYDFFASNQFSDVITPDESPHYSPRGCDCCAHIAHQYLLGRTEAEVYSCVDVHGNTYNLCGNCLVSAVNADFTWFDYYVNDNRIFI